MKKRGEFIVAYGAEPNLPTAASAQPNSKPDFTIVSIDALGEIYFEKEKVLRDDVLVRFQKEYDANHDVRIFIRADKDATYENVVFVLDKARTAGIQKVGLEIKAYETASDATPAAPAKTPSSP